MPSRVSRSKSHLGCRQCKSRHLKCDEKLPSCSRCLRAQRPCSFLEDIGPAPNVLPYPIGLASPTEAAPIPLDAMDADLFGHYESTTARFMAHREELQPLMQFTAPELAKTRPCLMHCMLAMSGYHLIACRESGADSAALHHRTIKHQDRALSLYLRGLRQQQTAEDKTAIFLVCVFLPFLSMITYRAVPPDGRGSGSGGESSSSSTPAIDKTVEVFRLLRGSDMLLYGDVASVTSGPLRPLLECLDFGAATAPAEPATEAALAALSAAVLPADDPAAPVTAAAHARKLDPTDDADVYRVGIHGLRAMYRALRASANDNAQLWGWINGAPLSEYLPRVRAREPRALAVLAHWAVAVYRRRDEWWLASGLGEGLVREICDLMPLEHQALVEWPAREIGLLPPSTHGSDQVSGLEGE